MLKVEWKTEKEGGAVQPHAALLRVNPWLAYGCAEGARLMIRKPTDTQGRCATVQRTLRDDSVVVRVDGVMGESTVDPTPLSVVRTSNPRHRPSTRLFFLYDKHPVDAVVEPGERGERYDVKEGSRHRLKFVSGHMMGWVTASDKEGAEQLRPPKEGPDDGSVLQVVSAKALVVHSGSDAKDTGRVGSLPPKTLVNVHEARTLPDGTRRVFISSIVAADAVTHTAALNDFNHAPQRFRNVAEYEAARNLYNEDIVEREALVEDAITGNLLRIKDQTLHVSTAADIGDNTWIPPEWRVDDVRDLVTLLLQSSPARANGSHSAQPTLVRAGPGTGKTWMTKQAVFTLADRLRSSVGVGIRLVPVVVFVQRIVFLIREGASGGLLSLYVESAYAGKKFDSWRKMLIQAYEMRALIVLIDGVDEAAGLRDEIEDFIHQELVPSGNRVIVTSRPEGVTLPRYTGRFVIMNLNELTNQQQRAVINIQMDGSQFFDHLLSLGEVRKQLDDGYAKLRESVQAELETLYAPSRFKKKDINGKGEVWDPDERQMNMRGERFIQEREVGAELTSSYLRTLDRQLHASAPQACAVPLLERLDDVLDELPPGATDEAFRAAVLEDMLPPRGDLELRHRVALDLGQMLRRKKAAEYAAAVAKRLRKATSKADAREDRKAATGGGQKGAPIDKDKAGADKAGAGADKAGVEVERAAPATSTGERAEGVLRGPLTAERLWAKLCARTDELYTVVERMQSIFENAMRKVAHGEGRDASEQAELANAIIFDEIKSPARAHEKAIEEFGSRFDDGVPAEACLTDMLRCRMAFTTGSQCISAIQRLRDGSYMGDDAPPAAPSAADSHSFKGGRRGSPAGPSAAAAAPEAAVANAASAVQIQMVNMVNKYAELDPTHFRQHILTLKLTYKGTSVYGEVEVHYIEIMKVGLAENSNAYQHYNFFRNRLLGTVPENELDSLLEEKLIFLVDATGIPVLLSLLVLIFTSGGEDLSKLPSNRIELYELGIESAINKRLQRGQPQKGDTGPMIYDQLIRHWMRLFNLDRSNMSVDDNPQFEQKKEREHRPTRKAQMKFEDLRTSAEQSIADKRANEKADEQSKDQKGAGAFKLDSREAYEVFKHASHYLREANKPEVQRTELNRIELSMPKKLVDTVMTLINVNLKLLLQGAAPGFGLTMLRNVAVTNQQNGRREFSSAHVSSALLLEYPTAEGFTLWVHLNKEEAGMPLIKTLEVQTDLAPAQYQFKHLSFQEVPAPPHTHPSTRPSTRAARLPCLLAERMTRAHDANAPRGPLHV